MHDVVLRSGRDRSLRRRHPWVLSGSVDRVAGDPAPGADARVISAEGEVLGFGTVSPHSAIRVRLHAFGKEEPPADWLPRRIERAVARRRRDPTLARTDAMRLVNAEGDGLPGLVADRYADTVVVRFAAAGLALRREEVADALRAASGCALGFERADSTAARREGISARQGPLWGEAPEGLVTIAENERRYRVDVVGGQKTGFYLDQREARDRVEAEARGRRVLDAFSYTGGFAAAAARGGATAVTAVDSSRSALALAEENLALNAGPDAKLDVVEADVFAFLRGGDERFDLLVIDPPPFAKRSADARRAARAYKDLLLRALRRAGDDALIFSFRCSHAISPELFRQIAFGASLDAGRPVQVIGSFTLPSDHPVALDHPEGDYFGGLLLRA